MASVLGHTHAPFAARCLLPEQLGSLHMALGTHPPMARAAVLWLHPKRHVRSREKAGAPTTALAPCTPLCGEPATRSQGAKGPGWCRVAGRVAEGSRSWAALTDEDEDTHQQCDEGAWAQRS